jgi:hypothetical protein
VCVVVVLAGGYLSLLSVVLLGVDDKVGGWVRGFGDGMMKRAKLLTADPPPFLPLMLTNHPTPTLHSHIPSHTHHTGGRDAALRGVVVVVVVCGGAPAHAAGGQHASQPRCPLRVPQGQGGRQAT